MALSEQNDFDVQTVSRWAESTMALPYLYLMNREESCLRKKEK
jgi:hypothetical protein